MNDEWIIETERLGLRRLLEADRRPLAAMDWLDVGRVMGRSADVVPHGFLAVILRGSGEFCGVCGLLPQELDHGTEIEVAYHLLPRFHGQGIATEAARAVMDHAFDRLDHRRIVSLIRPDNPASRRVAEKNGLRHERDLFFRGAVHGMHVIRKDRRESAT